MREARMVARLAALTLAVVALAEWFLFRLVSRFAAAPTLEGPPRTIIETLGQAGLFLVSPAFLLAALLLFLFTFLHVTGDPLSGRAQQYALAFFVAVLASVALAHSFLVKSAWLDASFNILSWLAVLWPALLFLTRAGVPGWARLGVALVALAYCGHYFYVLEQVVGGNAEGSARLAVAARDFGEVAALAAACAFFAATSVPGRQWSKVARWVVPVALGLVVAAGSIADAVFNQGFTAVFATWSLGFNMVWPWPLYAVALALFAFAILTCFSAGEGKGAFANANTGLGLVFLFVAGYELKVPYQHLLAILSVLLLTGLFRPLSRVSRAEQPSAGSQPVLTPRDSSRAG